MTPLSPGKRRILRRMGFQIFMHRDVVARRPFYAMVQVRDAQEEFIRSLKRRLRRRLVEQLIWRRR